MGGIRRATEPRSSWPKKPLCLIYYMTGPSKGYVELVKYEYRFVKKRQEAPLENDAQNKRRKKKIDFSRTFIN